jgi:hypothetical protein
MIRSLKHVEANKKGSRYVHHPQCATNLLISRGGRPEAHSYRSDRFRLLFVDGWINNRRVAYWSAVSMRTIQLPRKHSGKTRKTALQLITLNRILLQLSMIFCENYVSSFLTAKSQAYVNCPNMWGTSKVCKLTCTGQILQLSTHHALEVRLI